MLNQLCEFCGKTIARPDVAYHLKIELFADPAPPEFTREDIERGDPLEEMKALIEQMENLDPTEAEDEVFESYLFTLCAKCRGKTHRWLRAHHRHLEDL